MISTNSPLVSVIIITYNSAQYVIETLESVKSQSWRHIELIITDDCSTDNTIPICQEWLQNNSHFFVNTHLITTVYNTGTPANCNRGLKKATGDWIKTISGDDILLPNCISDNLNYAKQSNAIFIVSYIHKIDESGKTLSDKIVNTGLEYIVNLPTAKKQLKAYSRWPTFLNTPTFFCKKEIMKLIDYNDEDFRIYEDMTVIYRVTRMNVKVSYMNKTTVGYRIHAESVSRNNKMEEMRKKEAYRVFKKYRVKNLNILNPIDLSIYYESWLRYKYKGINGRKGVATLNKLSLFYWYLRLLGIRR